MSNKICFQLLYLRSAAAPGRIFGKYPAERKGMAVVCNTMRLLIAISFILLFCTALNAQKTRLESDNSRFLCLNDSTAETFANKLKKNKVDSTITILYDYDNGRLPNSRRIMLWTHDGASYIRLIEGCDKIRKDTTYTCNLTDLWQYIRVTHFDDITIPLKSGTGQSHDKFYHIAVTTPTESFYVVVRDNERKRTEKYKTSESDTRVMLTNQIDSLFH